MLMEIMIFPVKMFSHLHLFRKVKLQLLNVQKKTMFKLMKALNVSRNLLYKNVTDTWDNYKILLWVLININKKFKLSVLMKLGTLNHLLN